MVSDIREDIDFYEWAMEEEIAVVHGSNLERGNEFKVKVGETVYKMAVSDVIESISEDAEKDISDEHDVAFAGIISSREKCKGRYKDFYYY